jgi:hypothetical protein
VDHVAMSWSTQVVGVFRRAEQSRGQSGSSRSPGHFFEPQFTSPSNEENSNHA